MSFLTILSLIFGFVVLSGGAKLLCDSVIRLSHKLNLRSLALEVFLISIGTAAPDLVSALTAIFEKHPDISVGNILGSNFANLTLGFGIAALVSPFKCSKDITKIEFPLLFATTIFFIVCCLGGKITRIEGLISIAIFVLYMLFSVRDKKHTSKLTHKTADGESLKQWSMPKTCIVFAGASCLLALGAHIVVTSCFTVAKLIGVSENFIGFSLLSLGTSAPEIFVVSMAARRKNYSMCSGNIVGSNMINLMLIAGLCALVQPLILSEGIFWIEASALALTTIVSWYIFKTKDIFSRTTGACFVAIYFIVMFLAKG